MMSGQPSAVSGQRSFIVFPAIDVRGGQVVRLAQGDPVRQTVYAADPIAVAERWKADGAEWLHLVNLDGAFSNSPISNSLISTLASLRLSLQFGGGLRDESSLHVAFDAGIARAVIGTAAIENPALVDWAVRAFGPERIAVGIDAREGRVRIKGWAEDTAVSAVELGQRLRAQGVEWCVFTDVTRDGVGAGVNIAATTELARTTGLRVIASGGVASVEDVRAVREAGLAGVIIGRALYENHIQLSEAIGNSALAPSGALRANDVTLRLPRLTELDFIRWLWADPETMRAVGGPYPMSDEQAACWYAQMVNPGSPADCYFLILADDGPVGEASFHQFNRAEMSAELNIKVMAARRGRGFGKTALRLVLDYFFNTLGGRVMTDALALDNIEGQRTLRGLGFEHDPTRTDVHQMRLTRERFNSISNL